MCWQWEAPTSGTEWLNRAGPTIAFHLDDSKEYRDSFRDAEGDLKIMLFIELDTQITSITRQVITK